MLFVSGSASLVIDTNVLLIKQESRPTVSKMIIIQSMQDTRDVKFEEMSSMMMYCLIGMRLFV